MATIARKLRDIATEVESEWQKQERIRMCAEWLVGAILDENSEFKGHDKRLAEQLRDALK